jgi:MinD-like ATPase involved in chromosome partitioning or flagellar assembly
MERRARGSALGEALRGVRDARDGRDVREVRDQATGLRALAARRRAFDPGRRLGETTRVVAVTSGKGGVGKTSVAVNLGVALARRGKRVIVLDCDLGTANVDVMLGLHPRYSLQHVLSRQRRLDEVAVTGPSGLRIIPGGSGLPELANLTDERREELLAIFAQLDGHADILLLDTGAGISANVLRFVVAAGEAIVVTTPEPPAVTDAYALIKVASQQAGMGVDGTQGVGDVGDVGAVGDGGGAVSTLDAVPGGAGDGAKANGSAATPAAGPPLRLRLLVNQVAGDAEAHETAGNIATVARRFLNVAVETLGAIPRDPNVSRSIRSQVPLVEAFPRSPASLAIGRLAQQIAAEIDAQTGDHSPRPAAGLTPAAGSTPSAAAPPGSKDDAHGGVAAFVRRLLGVARRQGERP